MKKDIIIREGLGWRTSDGDKWRISDEDFGRKDGDTIKDFEGL